MESRITSRDFNRDVSAAKRAAEAGPVTITDHGRRSHVLLTAEEYDRLTGGATVLGARLRMTGDEHVELPLPDRAISPSSRVPDL